MVTLGWISNNMVPPYIPKKFQYGVKSKFNMRFHTVLTRMFMVLISVSYCVLYTN